MKKILTLIMAITMVLSLAACSSSKEPAEPQSESQSEVQSETNTEAQSETTSDSGAVDVLAKVWATYSDDESFSAMGGDTTAQVMNAPGKYSVSDTDGLDSTLGLPASDAAMIDDAASLIHMMNANTFTCGAFHLTDSANLETFETSLKDNITGRQWMCGFPDTLIIVSVNGDYVVSAFGNAEMIETLKTKLLEQYSDTAKVDYEVDLVA